MKILFFVWGTILVVQVSVASPTTEAHKTCIADFSNVISEERSLQLCKEALNFAILEELHQFFSEAHGLNQHLWKALPNYLIYAAKLLEPKDFASFIDSLRSSRSGAQLLEYEEVDLYVANNLMSLLSLKSDLFTGFNYSYCNSTIRLQWLRILGAAEPPRAQTLRARLACAMNTSEYALNCTEQNIQSTKMIADYAKIAKSCSLVNSSEELTCVNNRSIQPSGDLDAAVWGCQGAPLDSGQILK